MFGVDHSGGIAIDRGRVYVSENRCISAFEKGICVGSVGEFDDSSFGLAVSTFGVVHMCDRKGLHFYHKYLFYIILGIFSLIWVLSCIYHSDGVAAAVYNTLVCIFYMCLMCIFGYFISHY